MAIEPPANSRACPFCATIFSRVDGARRHAKRCPSRNGHEIPNRKRGRRAKSCTSCSRLKVHCYVRQGVSCDRCTSRKLHCSFDARSTAFLRDGEDLQATEPTGIGNGHMFVAFLLNSTDEGLDFVTERAVGEQPDSALVGPLLNPFQQHEDIADPLLSLPSDAYTWLTSLELGIDEWHETEDLLGGIELFSNGDLSSRIALLKSQLTAHCGSASDLEGQDIPESFDPFFTATNITEYAATFCRKRRYHYQILHWPTITLQEVALPLLLVVALTGATYSLGHVHGSETVNQARSLYRLADSFIFRQLDRCVSEPRTPGNTTAIIQHCQAALLMYALCNLWAGEATLRHLAITRRLPTIISALRQLSFIGCRHQIREPWSVFLEREQIVRLVAWTFCSDGLATLCYNSPPAFALPEMTGDLPCGPTLWESTAPVRIDLCDANRHCLRDLVGSLLSGDASPRPDFDGIPLFHLQATLCGT